MIKQLLAFENGKKDIIYNNNGKYFLIVNTQETMSSWFKRCLKQAVPNLIYGKLFKISVDEMFAVIDVYINTR